VGIRIFPPDITVTSSVSTGTRREVSISSTAPLGGSSWQGISAAYWFADVTLAPYHRALARLAGFCPRSAPRRNNAYVILIAEADWEYVTRRSIRRTKPTYARELARAVRPLRLSLADRARAIACRPAGVLLMRVLYTKQTRGRTFVCRGRSDERLLRPVLYGATHPITRARRGSGTRERADIVGPVCESGDCFVQDWPLGKVNSSDLLVLWEPEPTVCRGVELQFAPASRRSAC